MQIYVIVHKTTGKCYVGRTVSDKLYDYLSVKRWQVRHNSVSGMPIIVAIRAYGWDSFDVRTVATCTTENELNNLERLWIIMLRATDPTFGYNVLEGGTGTSGHPCSDERKRKIGLANRGRKPVGYVRTTKHRQQLRDRMLGNKHSTGDNLIQWLKTTTSEYRIARAKQAAAARWGRVAIR